MSKLVYIASTAHSGSTLLDMVIGSIPRVFSAGQIRLLPWQLDLEGKSRTSVENRNVCTCLKKVSECEIWSQIIKILNKKIGYNALHDPYRLNLSFLKSQMPKKQANFATKVANSILSRGISFPIFELVFKLYKFGCQEIIKNNWHLFDAICEACDVDYVVDSSKDYKRFKFLHSHSPNDVYLIISKREDIFGFAHSHMKRGVQPEISLKQRKDFYDKIKKIIKHTRNLKYLNITYEELCIDPIRERRRIANFLNLPNPGSALKINTQDYHIVNANLIRYNGEIAISFDDEWKEKLSKKQIEEIKLIHNSLYNSKI